MLHSYAFACPNYLKRVVDGVKLKQFSECHEPQPCRQQYRAFPGWLGLENTKLLGGGHQVAPLRHKSIQYINTRCECRQEYILARITICW